MSTPIYTREQVEWLESRRHPTVRRLAITARTALEQRDDAQYELRAAQEALAAAQLKKERRYGERLLVVLHRDGFVEVWAKSWRPVQIACMPDFGRERFNEAEQYMLSKLPFPYRELYERKGKQIVAGSIHGCATAEAIELAEWYTNITDLGVSDERYDGKVRMLGAG